MKVYVFGVKRKIDVEPWFVATPDKVSAVAYPKRCTEVFEAELTMLPETPAEPSPT
jgi:hypothetical protein